tara:strand:+ start:177 stop:521 length:345 start_codon:yes stop_codon:yes gene_type:complete
MAIPSGSGTEVLKVAKVHAMSSGATTLITGVANHIYTVLSINFTNMSGSDESIDLYVTEGSDTYMLLRETPIADKATFMYNDKFVLSGAQTLKANLATSGDCDVWVSYIDQDWS